MGRIERQTLNLWMAGKSVNEIASYVGVLTRDVLAILRENGFSVCSHCGKHLSGGIDTCSHGGFCVPVAEVA